MIRSKLLKNNEGWLYCDITNVPVSLASIIIPYGYNSIELEKGYAHLMEHMVIRSNQKYFNFLESQGIIYNAETQAEKILFTFLDFGGNVLEKEIYHFKNILKTDFSQTDLDIEKKTILQEHLYRANIFSIESVNQAIGSKEEINSFNLKGLEEIHKEASKHYKILYISPEIHNLNSVLKLPENQDIEDDWYKNIKITNISESDNNITINVNSDIYSELLAYLLNVLCMCSFEQGKMKRCKKSNNIEIKLDFSKEKFLTMLKDKEKSFSRYIIYLDTIKVYYQELANYINNIGIDLDVEKCYMSHWEMKLLESI